MEYDTPPGRSYRYYTGQPLFPFGSGLSLTTFTHSCTCAKLTLQQDDSDISCSCTVHNTGTVAGDEVLMVYDSLSAGIRSKIGKAHPVPLKRLVEFERVTVAAGKSAPVPFKIPKKALSRRASWPGPRTGTPRSSKWVCQQLFLESFCIPRQG